MKDHEILGMSAEEWEREKAMAEFMSQPNPNLEIFSKTSRQIGGVTVNFTFGRIRKNGDRGGAA